MAAGLFECAPDQIDFKAAHFLVEIDAAANVADRRITRTVMMTGSH